jgi:hypothetical protein
MPGMPQELFFALVFGAVLLVQFLYKQLRRKAASGPLEAEPAAPAAPLPSTVARTHAAPAEAGSDGTTGTSEARQAPVAARAALQAGPSNKQPRPRKQVRRFSRTALMPDRHAVQNAVVIAAILQPCHAHRPQGLD